MRVNAREIRDVPEDELLDVLNGLVSWEEVQCIVVGDEIVAIITFLVFNFLRATAQLSVKKFLLLSEFLIFSLGWTNELDGCYYCNKFRGSTSSSGYKNIVLVINI